MNHRLTLRFAPAATALCAALLAGGCAMSPIANQQKAEPAWQRINGSYEKGTVVPPAAKPDTTPTATNAPAQQPAQDPAPVPPVPKEAWEVQNGRYLGETLAEWSTRAGWGFQWDLPPDRDFRLGATDTYEGDFKTAIKTLINALPGGIRIRVELRPDNTPPLLYVSAEEGAR